MGRMYNWLEIYLRWKAANPTAKADTRQRMVRGCRGKFAHPDFLSALLHAKALASNENAKVAIYCCDLCHKAHVGNWHGGYSREGQQPWERDRRNWRHFLTKEEGGIGINPDNPISRLAEARHD